MKIPLGFYCIECKRDNSVPIDLADTSFDFTCVQCGYRNYGPFDLQFTLGDRLRRRAVHELRVNRDPSLSIVFSAMALDCEVSRLHHKWERIDALLSLTDVAQDVLDERLRRFPNIAAKIEGVAKLLHGAGIEDFVAGDAELCTALDNGFRTIRRGSLATDFQQQLFWPRNRILHAGYSGYKDAEAVACLNSAVLGLWMFEKMDLGRRQTV